MQTRKALELLSKGDKQYEDRVNTSLLDRSEQYLAAYDEADREILAKQNSELVQLPFLESLRRKVSRMVESPDHNLPIVARFDLFTGVRKLAERSQGRDQGLVRLASLLERAWHEEPLGTMTYGQVSSLVQRFKDQYPRSKAADAIEAECTRVGLHKLPVAKLARIASHIETQEDYDVAMETHGFAGDRPEQIRARALVRGLVALRGSEVDSHEPQARDERSNEERIADKFAQMAPPAPPMMEEEMAPPADDLGMDMPLDPAMDGLDSEPGDGEVGPGEMDESVELLQEIQDAADDIIQDAPPAAMDYIDHEMSEGHQAPPGTAEWGAEEILLEDHSAPPPSPEWLAEEEQELSEQGIPGGMDMGMGAPPPAPPPGPGPMGANMTAAKGKGIPLPGKIKTQPEVTTYAKEVGKDGGKVLKANDVEEALLDGKSVKVGEITIRINEDMEVELWNKQAGRACDLMHLDTAIADFMAMVNAERARRLASKTPFTFHIAETVNVPCEVCGDMNLFEKAANVSDDEYGCPCGHLISANSVEELMKIAQYGKAFQIEVKYQVDPQNPQRTKQNRDMVMKALRQVTRDQMQIHDEGKGYIVSSTNSEYFDPDKAAMQLQTAGGQAEVKRVAQMGAPGAQPPAGLSAPKSPSGPAPDNSDIPGLPLGEVANAAFMNYRAQGMTMQEAWRSFLKEHGDRWGSESDDGSVMQALMANYASAMGAPAAPAAPGAPAAEPPPQPGGAGMMASKVAEGGMKEPAIRKPKDHVSVPKDLGPDSETKGGVPSPGKIKQQQGKPDGKLSDTDLGEDSEGKDLLPDPGKPSVEHDPKSQKGTSLPDTNLGSDSEGNDPFKVPGQGAKPSVSKNKK